MQAPPPIHLARTSPRITTHPDHTRRGYVYGICEEATCTYRTPSFPSSGYIASLAAVHGLVLDDTPIEGVPVCPSVIAVPAQAAA